MNAITSVEAAGAVSANDIGLPALDGRKRRSSRTWPDAKVDQLVALIAQNMTFEDIGAKLGISRGAVCGQVNRMRQFGDDRVPAVKKGRRPTARKPRDKSVRGLRRFGSIKPGRGIQLAADHPAVVDGRPLFAGRVVGANDVARVLISGVNSRKIGKVATKGPRKGFPIYTLTLPERATCPRTCAAWEACYGNGMNWANRIKPGRALHRKLWDELYQLQLRHPRGFLLRMHVLGDFYSEEYVDLIDQALDAYPALHVFGFTARDPDTDEIGSALWAMTQARWDRFTIRFSGMGGGCSREPRDRAAGHGPRRHHLPGTDRRDGLLRHVRPVLPPRFRPLNCVLEALMAPAPLTPAQRRAIEDEIERLIALLDVADGDPDFEPEIDVAADDIGEREGDAFLDLAA